MLSETFYLLGRRGMASLASLLRRGALVAPRPHPVARLAQHLAVDRPRERPRLARNLQPEQADRTLQVLAGTLQRFFADGVKLLAALRVFFVGFQV